LALEERGVAAMNACHLIAKRYFQKDLIAPFTALNVVRMANKNQNGFDHLS
jgi:hypothetical protein